MRTTVTSSRLCSPAVDQWLKIKKLPTRRASKSLEAGSSYRAQLSWIRCKPFRFISGSPEPIFTSAQTTRSNCWKIHKNIYQREEDYLSVQPQETKKSLLYSWARREYWMGLLGKVLAAKAVKGHRDDKKEKKEEAAEAAKPEEKKWK